MKVMESMDTHKKVLGTIYIAYGSFLFLVLSIVYFVIFGIVIGDKIQEDMSHREAELIFSIIRFIFGFIIIFFTLPSIIGGIALLSKKSWGMTLLVIVGCLSLLSFPVGTAIGAYTLWVFFKDQELKKYTPADDFKERSN